MRACASAAFIRRMIYTVPVIDARLQFFHDRKMQKNTRFLSTTANGRAYLPTVSAFQVHKVLDLLAEIRLRIYRYIETRCLAARLYAFEDNSEVHRYLWWFLCL